MKLKIAWLAILCVAVAAIPAWAGYDNGPIYGIYPPPCVPQCRAGDAWVINFGYIVSDSFLSDGSTVGGFSFGVWEFPGDVLRSVDWSITSAENGGTVYGSGTASGPNLTDKFISTNQFGYNIDEIGVSGVNLSQVRGATYWLNLQNAAVPAGDPVYWDENSGRGCRGAGCQPACFRCASGTRASESAVGTIPSEAFTIDSSFGGGASGPSGPTPEPSSSILFGSGALGLAGLLRRKLRC